MQREGKGWAKGIAKASYGAVYANVVREHGTFVDATGARIGDRNAKKAMLRWQWSLEAGLQPPIGAPYIGGPPIGRVVGAPPIGAPRIGAPPIGALPIGAPPIGAFHACGIGNLAGAAVASGIAVAMGMTGADVWSGNAEAMGIPGKMLAFGFSAPAAPMAYPTSKGIVAPAVGRSKRSPTSAAGSIGLSIDRLGPPT